MRSNQSSQKYQKSIQRVCYKIFLAFSVIFEDLLIWILLKSGEIILKSDL